MAKNFAPKRDSSYAPDVSPDIDDRADRDLLRFTISWLPYGAVPEDELLIRFGLTRSRFPGRLREAIERRRRQIHPETTARLLDLCTSVERGGRG